MKLDEPADTPDSYKLDQDAPRLARVKDSVFNESVLECNKPFMFIFTTVAKAIEHFYKEERVLLAYNLLVRGVRVRVLGFYGFRVRVREKNETTRSDRTRQDKITIGQRHPQDKAKTTIYAHTHRASLIH
jgi:hypothetical protein